MKILHYIPSIDRTSGGVGAYMQLLTTELGKLVELHVVTHREAINPEKPDVPINKNDEFQKVQKRRVQEKR